MFGDVERQWRNVYVFFTRKDPVVRVESFKLVIPRFKRATVPSKMKHRDANDACTLPLYFEDADEMQAVLTEVHERIYELKNIRKK